MTKDPTRVSEGDLVMPTLEALVNSKAIGLSTSELVPILREVLKPAGKDLEISPHRNDDYFSEKVRNLKSHKKLEKMGVATFDGTRYQITAKGKKFVNDVQGARESYKEQGFKKALINRSIKPEKTVFVEEGHQRVVSKVIRARSQKLRDFALKTYSKADDTIDCRGCGFEGSNVYGNTGKGLIEIHHKKPISTSGVSKIDLRKAVKNVVPLCPNCHRLVHRKSGEVMELGELKKLTGK
ncbi:HNH endonuclease [Primorskyibacter flagellatus]|nr:HNH endonuclease [Primorskyibacter flagellatus]